MKFTQSRKIAISLVVRQTDPSGRYLPAQTIIDKVNQFTDMVGREPAMLEFYNERDSGLRFPTALFEEVRKKLGCHLHLQLWPNEIDFTGVPTNQHSLASIIAGNCDTTLINDLAKPANAFGPITIGTDEPSGFLWGHESQGGSAPDTLDGQPWPKGPAQFIRAWRHIYEVVSAHAPNTTWLLRSVPGWGEDNPSNPNWWKRLKYWYPGAGYVDQIGINALSYSVLDYDGTELWPRGTTPDQSLDMILAETEGLPTFPLHIGIGGSDDERDPGAKARWLDHFLALCNRNPRIQTISVWIDDTYARDADITKFPITAAALRRWLTLPAFTSHLCLA